MSVPEIPVELADPPRRLWPAFWPPAAKDAADQLRLGLWRARQSREEDTETTAQALAEAVAELGERGGAAIVRDVQAIMIRDLLERAYPDGLTGELVQEVLVRCAVAASEHMDDAALVDDLAVVLGGALGMSEEFSEAANARTLGRYLRAGLLVIDDLLVRTGLDAAAELESSMGEICRSETMEMP